MLTYTTEELSLYSMVYLPFWALSPVVSTRMPFSSHLFLQKIFLRPVNEREKVQPRVTFLPSVTVRTPFSAVTKPALILQSAEEEIKIHSYYLFFTWSAIMFNWILEKCLHQWNEPGVEATNYMYSKYTGIKVCVIIVHCSSLQFNQILGKNKNANVIRS